MRAHPLCAGGKVKRNSPFAKTNSRINRGGKSRVPDATLRIIYDGDLGVARGRARDSSRWSVLLTLSLGYSLYSVWARVRAERWHNSEI